jgi:hypothetical protein
MGVGLGVTTNQGGAIAHAEYQNSNYHLRQRERCERDTTSLYVEIMFSATRVITLAGSRHACRLLNLQSLVSFSSIKFYASRLHPPSRLL